MQISITTARENKKVLNADGINRKTKLLEDAPSAAEVASRRLNKPLRMLWIKASWMRRHFKRLPHVSLCVLHRHFPRAAKSAKNG